MNIVRRLAAKKLGNFPQEFGLCLDPASLISYATFSATAGNHQVRVVEHSADKQLDISVRHQKTS